MRSNILASFPSKFSFPYLAINDQIEKKEEEIAQARRNIKKIEDYRV